MANTTKKYTTKQFLDAIRGGQEMLDGKKLPSSGAIMTTIANRVGCDWHTAKTYIKENKVLQEAYNDEVEKVKDLCESTLLNSIISGDTNDAKWWLTKKAKDRGFDDTIDTTVSGDITIRVVRDRLKE